LKVGITGTVICGGGSAGTLEALPMPLGSASTLFSLPTFAGPGGIPLMDRFPVPRFAGQARKRSGRACQRNYKCDGNRCRGVEHDEAPWLDERVVIVEADLGSSSFRATKLNFKMISKKTVGGFGMHSHLISSSRDHEIHEIHEETDMKSALERFPIRLIIS
jgi:hypothetical protein